MSHNTKTPAADRPAGLRELPAGHFWRIRRTRLHVVIEVRRRRRRGSERVGIAICTPQEFANAATDRLKYSGLAYHDAFAPRTREVGDYL